MSKHHCGHIIVKTLKYFPNQLVNTHFPCQPTQSLWPQGAPGGHCWGKQLASASQLATAIYSRPHPHVFIVGYGTPGKSACIPEVICLLPIRLLLPWLRLPAAGWHTQSCPHITALYHICSLFFLPSPFCMLVLIIMCNPTNRTEPNAFLELLKGSHTSKLDLKKISRGSTSGCPFFYLPFSLAACNLMKIYGMSTFLLVLCLVIGSLLWSRCCISYWVLQSWRLHGGMEAHGRFTCHNLGNRRFLEEVIILEDSSAQMEQNMWLQHSNSGTGKEGWHQIRKGL